MNRPSIANQSCAISNRFDCNRYDCPEMPWHWASNWVLEQVSLQPQMTVVDLGAGNNPILDAAFKNTGAKAVLVDKFVPIEPSNSHVVLTADMSELPLANESVDAVVSVSAFEHISPEKQVATIQEVWRILKSDAVAAITFGHLFNANEEASSLLTTLPFFVDRGCPVFLPLNIHKVVEQSDFCADDCPGPIGNDLLSWPDLVTEKWNSYTQLQPYSCLSIISHCEIGIRLVKRTVS